MALPKAIQEAEDKARRRAHKIARELEALAHEYSTGMTGINEADLVMVLNDGDTYTGLQGCKIVEVENASRIAAEDDGLERALKDGEYNTIVAF